MNLAHKLKALTALSGLARMDLDESALAMAAALSNQEVAAQRLQKRQANATALDQAYGNMAAAGATLNPVAMLVLARQSAFSRMWCAQARQQVESADHDLATHRQGLHAAQLRQEHLSEACRLALRDMAAQRERKNALEIDELCQLQRRHSKEQTWTV